MSDPSSPISSLPNEILIAVLSTFPTKELPPLASINRQFYSLVVRTLQGRLLRSAPLPDNKLIMEAYHPTAKFYTPYLACQYQNTIVRDGSVHCKESPTLSDLWKLYGSFRPTYAEENRRPRRIRARFVAAQPSKDADDDTATHQVNLDEDELFSQLCTCVNVVKEGPKHGLFISHVNVVDGVIRIFRRWLAELAGQNSTGDASDESRIIWVDNAKNVGIRFRVVPDPSERMPLVSGPDEDPPVSYTLEYDELLVRASKILEGVEEAYAQVHDNGVSGKTLVIAALQ
ncbi:Fc.00g091630.m01.CDS01 [Cosmosporella sp. VM-42]